MSQRKKCFWVKAERLKVSLLLSSRLDWTLISLFPFHEQQFSNSCPFRYHVGKISLFQPTLQFFYLLLFILLFYFLFLIIFFIYCYLFLLYFLSLSFHKWYFQGVVANFVETEQIVEIKTPKGSYISAFVQIRGSIPLLWSQIPNIKYKPTTRLAPASTYKNAFDQHMGDIINSYKVKRLLTAVLWALSNWFWQ